MIWFRNNQSKICAHLYNEFTNTISRDVNVDMIILERRFIFFFNYTNDDRFMLKYYQNNMIIVRYFEKFTLFITFTINSNWIKIKHELTKFLNQIAANRSNIVTQIFQMKMIQLLNDVKKRQMFDEFNKFVWIVKYQKKNLSYVHMLLFLKEIYFTETKNIDNVICVKFSNFVIDSNDVLQNIVQK